MSPLTKNRLTVGFLACCVLTSTVVSVWIVKHWAPVGPLPKVQGAPQLTLASGPAQIIDLVHAPSIGPAAAPVSLVEFSDFECPFCAADAPVIHQLIAAYPSQLSFAFKSYPLPMHRESALAHEAALAAGDQGAFWRMHDLLFASQDQLNRADLIAKASQLHLDVPQFTRDLDRHRFKGAVDADRREGDRLGVDGTPYFFLNGHGISGAHNLAEFRQLIETTLKDNQQRAMR